MTDIELITDYLENGTYIKKITDILKNTTEEIYNHILNYKNGY